jgi:(E)-4-hydroxy-3-methylbut-2-enyl-diphosphate synthase
LGVTESGSKDNAVIKSSIGLAPLLQKGIGDTIRVSITGDPTIEPIICKKILNNLGLYKNIPNIISCPTCGRLQ